MPQQSGYLSRVHHPLDRMRRIQNVYPQLRYMKHIMNIRKRRWKIYLIGQLSYLLHNLVRINDMRSELSQLQSSANTSYRSNPKKHLISLSELKFFPFLIMITLLTTLRSLHLLLSYLDLLCGLLDNLISNHNLLS